MKIRHAMIAAVMSLFLAAGVSEAQNVLPYDFSEIEGKVRSIRGRKRQLLELHPGRRFADHGFRPGYSGRCFKKNQLSGRYRHRQVGRGQGQVSFLVGQYWDWFET